MITSGNRNGISLGFMNSRLVKRASITAVLLSLTI
jgi:hypothetical protein